MDIPLKVLIIEDSDSDAALAALLAPILRSTKFAT
jgi:hypothetical protein